MYQCKAFAKHVCACSYFPVNVTKLQLLGKYNLIETIATGLTYQVQLNNSSKHNIANTYLQKT